MRSVVERWAAAADVVTWPAGMCDLVLVLDNREVREKRDRQYLQECLLQNGVNVETRPLPVGDVLWVLRPPATTSPTDDDIVAGHVIERKRMDDLLASMKDGRLREQRVRPRNHKERRGTHEGPRAHSGDRSRSEHGRALGSSG